MVRGQRGWLSDTFYSAANGKLVPGASVVACLVASSPQALLFTTAVYERGRKPQQANFKPILEIRRTKLAKEIDCNPLHVALSVALS